MCMLILTRHCSALQSGIRTKPTTLVQNRNGLRTVSPQTVHRPRRGVYCLNRVSFVDESSCSSHPEVASSLSALRDDMGSLSPFGEADADVESGSLPLSGDDEDDDVGDCMALRPGDGCILTTSPVRPPPSPSARCWTSSTRDGRSAHAIPRGGRDIGSPRVYDADKRLGDRT